MAYRKFVILRVVSAAFLALTLCGLVAEVVPYYIPLWNPPFDSLLYRLNLWITHQLTWQHVEIYKEFITNGLDLVSFILMTPQILYFFGYMPLVLTGLFVVVGGMIVLVCLPIGLIILPFTRHWTWLWTIVSVFFGFIGLYLYTKFLSYTSEHPDYDPPALKSIERMDRLATRTKKRMEKYAKVMFTLGILTFITSRVIAFIIALYALP